MCIKHVYKTFCIVIVDFVDHGKISKSVVWYFSLYKVISRSFIYHSLLFLCRLFYSSKYDKIFMVGYLWYDKATVIFLDFSENQKYMLVL
jgi:hypothetical protein